MGRVNSHGFSLFELLIVLTIVVVICFVAIPSWWYWQSSHRAMLAKQQLIRILQYSRQEAVNRQQRLYLCGSSDGKHCDGSWSQFQLLKVVKTARLLKVFQSTHAMQIRFRGNFAQDDHLQFTPLGFTYGQQGSFYLTSTKNKICARLIVHYTGRVSEANCKI